MKKFEVIEAPILHNLSYDPSEHFDLYGEHPKVLAEIAKAMVKHIATIKLVKNPLTKR